jgi:dimethylhistidine N-methyltransferase/nicotinate (nicotinamide) nucleotide adenylyltransferase
LGAVNTAGKGGIAGCDLYVARLTQRERQLPAKDPIRARRIGLLGGSFNPAHAGHREISLEALKRLRLDAVWWLVTPGSPLKDAEIYADYDERLHQARSMANHADIVVSDFEKRRGLQYTVDTLVQIKDANPTAAFVWLMGADSLASFHKWKDWRRIAELVPIAVFNRPGYSGDAITSKAAQTFANFRIDCDHEDLLGTDPPAWTYIEETDNPLSSTALRSKSTKPNGDADIARDNFDADLAAPYGALAFFLDLHPDVGDFREDVIEGLSRPQKSLSPKYFYDEEGSKLFRQITDLPEYYPTRTEKKIFLENAKDIAAAPGSNAAVFEYGSGASEKIEWLLNGLADPAAYVAMDISRDYLIQSASAIAKKFDLPVAAVCADFHGRVKIPSGVLPEPSRWLGFFPGSTIGNMAPDDAARFLRRAGETLGEGAHFLLGVDLEKETAALNAAYNDDAGVTAAFNINLLARMQRELGAELSIEDFEHHAFYNEEDCRIEMHLRAKRPTKITLGDHVFPFKADETLHTENSYKYSINRLEGLFSDTPWALETVWTDENDWFAACLLSNR